MGCDDIFHKRKARKSAETERKKSKRKPYDRVLIVCEGSKTEPIYFEELRVTMELDSANIQIDGSCGSSPISVVRHAYNEYLQDKRQGHGEFYNTVFCVFDKDTHSTYQEAIGLVQSINDELKEEGVDKETKFHAITSVPCFEYWLLLHYIPSTQPFLGTGTKSAGDRLIDELRNYIPHYVKTQRGIFKSSCNNGTLQFALGHSKRIFDASLKSGCDNPSTNVHILVEYLMKLKDDQDDKSRS